jgi:hypothetical protein
MVRVFDLPLPPLDPEEGGAEDEVAVMEAGTELAVEEALVGLEELVNMPEVISGMPRKCGYETVKVTKRKIPTTYCF